jgi:SAM-dependent methyltransferase
MSSIASEANRELFRDRGVVEGYVVQEGWIDHGERIALDSVASEVRGQPILDLGVGGGRTTSLMRLLTDDYVGIDYSPEMVEACLRVHPGLDIRYADARDLNAFDSSTFKLAFFSAQGLDCVDHADRERVISEVHRVLVPDGIFGYSTHLMHGTFYDKRPWHQAPWRSSKTGRLDTTPVALGHPQIWRFVRFAFYIPSRLRKYPRLYANWWRNRALADVHQDWAFSPYPNNDFNLSYFATPEGERKILAEHGFTVLETIASTGQRVDNGSEMPLCPWFFVVARKMER